MDLLLDRVGNKYFVHYVGAHNSYKPHISHGNLETANQNLLRKEHHELN